LRTWAIFWYASIFERGGLCLNPTRALAINKGNDGSGEHVGLVAHHQDLYDGPVVKFPDLIEENNHYFHLLQTIYRSKNNYVKSFIKTLIGRMPGSFQVAFYEGYRALLRRIKHRI